MRRAAASALIAFVFLACGSFGASSDDVPVTTEAGPRDDGATPTSEGGAPDATPDGPACNLKTLTGFPVADTGLLACSAASYGSSDAAKIGVNAGAALGIFRFHFAEELVQHIATVNVQRIVLHLTANVKCIDCDGGIETSAGVMQAHIARNDWDEGGTAPDDYAGADLCRRAHGVDGKGWSSDGHWSATTYISSPNDYDIAGFVVQIDAGQHEVDVPIRELSPRGLQELNVHQEISFMVEMLSGVFVASTRESAHPPTLTITYCE